MYALSHLLELTRWHILEYLEFGGRSPPRCAHGLRRDGCRRGALSLRHSRCAASTDAGDGHGLNHSSLREFANGPLLRDARLQAFAHGNISADAGSAMLSDACASLGARPLSSSQWPSPRCLELPAGVEVWLRQHASCHTELQRRRARASFAVSKYSTSLHAPCTLCSPQARQRRRLQLRCRSLPAGARAVHQHPRAPMRDRACAGRRWGPTRGPLRST